MLDAAEADVSDADLAQLSNQRGVLNYRPTAGSTPPSRTCTSAHELAALAGDWRTDLMALVNLGAIQSQRAEYDDARERLHEAITLAARSASSRPVPRRSQPRLRGDERGQPA